MAMDAWPSRISLLMWLESDLLRKRLLSLPIASLCSLSSATCRDHAPQIEGPRNGQMSHLPLSTADLDNAVSVDLGHSCAAYQFGPVLSHYQLHLSLVVVACVLCLQSIKLY